MNIQDLLILVILAVKEICGNCPILLRSIFAPAFEFRKVIHEFRWNVNFRGYEIQYITLISNLNFSFSFRLYYWTELFTLINIIWCTKDSYTLPLPLSLFFQQEAAFLLRCLIHKHVVVLPHVQKKLGFPTLECDRMIARLNKS